MHESDFPHPVWTNRAGVIPSHGGLVATAPNPILDQALSLKLDPTVGARHMTKVRLVRIENDPGIEYTRQQLQAGKSLAHALDSVITPNITVSALLPAGFGPQQMRDLSSGLVNGLRFSDVKRRLIKLILPWMGTGVGGHARYCVFEDPESRPTDPYVRRLSTPLFFHRDEVYLIADGADKEQVLSEVIEEARGYPLIGVLTELPADAKILDHELVPDEVILQIARGTAYAIVGVYDQESVLILKLRDRQRVRPFR